MKYQCGPFIYDLPITACVFCQNADIYWDYSSGIYMISCPEHEVDKHIALHGCDKRKDYPEGTKFTYEKIKISSPHGYQITNGGGNDEDS